ncbi:G-protein coupled receptor Mth2-like [Ischnura elegans]|uniref:G-protein coupled receptor Mth2-like n=1 Tax=Ischnura elegans TaxID=197161 RepID=UPI001ED8B318|nr:G-protein coupled receptor Mth2-like [Ischnura elegans]
MVHCPSVICILASLIAIAPFLTVTTHELTTHELCPPWQRSEIRHAIFFSNGTIKDVDANQLYPPGTHWAETANGTTTLYACPCKLSKPCLRKCCPWDHAMDNDTLQCVPHRDSPSSRDWFRPRTSADTESDVIELSQFSILYGNYCWGFLLEPQFYPGDEFYINATDGTLEAPLLKKFGWNTSNYCLEYVENDNLYLPYVCFPLPIDYEHICDTLRYSIYNLGMTISIVFLIISLVIYSTTSELRNLHGKRLMCHIVSLLVGYISLAIVQIAGGNLNENTCTAFGFVIYFSMLCSYFWPNIMCIDIYIAFSSTTPPKANSSEMKKFFTYILYGWGLPLVIIIVIILMDFHPIVESEKYLKPEFQVTCWFYTARSRLAYFFAPISVLFICNIILFALTAFNIYKVNRETKILRKGSSSSSSREDKNRVRMYINLCVVMVFGLGVSWSFEIISYILGGSECMWLIADTTNTLQGFLVFWIFVWKGNVKKITRKRYRTLIAKLRNACCAPGKDGSNKQQKADVEQPASSTSCQTLSSSLQSMELTTQADRDIS